MEFSKKFTRTDEGVEWTVTDETGKVRGKGFSYTYGIADLQADGWISELNARAKAANK